MRLQTTLPGYYAPPVPDTRAACVRERGHDIIQPKAPLRKGEGLLCPSVPRAKDRAARCRLTILASVRPSTCALTPFVYSRASLSARACVSASVCTYTLPRRRTHAYVTPLVPSTLTGIAYPSWVFLVAAGCLGRI